MLCLPTHNVCVHLLDGTEVLGIHTFCVYSVLCVCVCVCLLACVFVQMFACVVYDCVWYMNV